VEVASIDLAASTLSSRSRIAGVKALWSCFSSCRPPQLAIDLGPSLRRLLWLLILFALTPVIPDARLAL